MKKEFLIGGLLLAPIAIWGIFYLLNPAKNRRRVFRDLGERERLSDSEIAAGHPIVGVS